MNFIHFIRFHISTKSHQRTSKVFHTTSQRPPTQMEPKGDPKSTKTPSESTSGSPGGPLGDPGAPTWCPGAPTWCPRVPKWCPRVPKWSPRAPKWCPMVPKWYPRVGAHPELRYSPRAKIASSQQGAGGRGEALRYPPHLVRGSRAC